jgi:hypothetical protein
MMMMLMNEVMSKLMKIDLINLHDCLNGYVYLEINMFLYFKIDLKSYLSAESISAMIK